MKWILLTTAFTSGVSYGSTLTPVTIYGDDSYAPYSYNSFGQAKGIYVDILKMVFEKMPDYNVTIKLVPWKRGLKMLEVGQAFALFPPYYYDDKRFYISPYSKPILKEEVTVYCNKAIAHNSNSNWPSDYLGLTVGINESFSLGGREFWIAARRGDITVKEAKGNQANIINLYNKQTACYMNDRLSILWEIKQLTQTGMISPDWEVTSGPVISGEYGYLGFTNVGIENFPYKKAFITQFNQQLEQVKQSGKIEAIIKRYSIEK
ncbi:substrate-binding periplasmic protein [Vibrio aquaticus]|uniref:substrate-binding periplasmic protein n=1 Tax=Vibrio aquaticus TaxID=2496559 RepID=UPI001FC9CBA2|nr:transporter substrate-binding domain-containing protein [Vibrio aquaticus]